mgnify:CR=1 FL=1
MSTTSYKKELEIINQLYALNMIDSIERDSKIIRAKAAAIKMRRFIESSKDDRKFENIIDYKKIYKN